MKFKWFKALCISAFMGAITSCVVDNRILEEGGGTGNSDETGYISVSIGLSSSSDTRANPPEEQGINIERKATKVRVVLYDPDELIVKYRFDLNVSNVDGSQTFTGSDVSTAAGAVNTNFTSAAKEVAKQEYQMLVLVNAPTSLEVLTEKDCSMSSLLAAIERNNLQDIIGVPSGVYNSSGAYSFFMSNAKGLITVRENGDLYDTAAEAEQYPVTMRVDRAVAKVMVDDSQLTITNATLNDTKWRLDLTNKKTYWMRKFAYILGGTTMETGGNTMTDREYLYAEDPNFDGFSNDRWGYQIKDLTQEFNSISKSDIIIPTGNSAWEYALENTMAAEEQWEDVTTRVVIETNYIPDGFSTNESYYVYAGNVIKVADMDDYVNGTKEVPSIYEGLQNAIIDARTDNFDLKNRNNGSFHAYKIRYYHEGICYYSVPIRHFNNTQEPESMGYGRYGIVRNNVYKLNLLTLSGIGGIEIPPPGGENDKEDVWVSAYVDILPWYIREQDVENL